MIDHTPGYYQAVKLQTLFDENEHLLKLYLSYAEIQTALESDEIDLTVTTRPFGHALVAAYPDKFKLVGGPHRNRYYPYDHGIAAR